MRIFFFFDCLNILKGSAINFIVIIPVTLRVQYASYGYLLVLLKIGYFDRFIEAK